MPRPRAKARGLNGGLNGARDKPKMTDSTVLCVKPEEKTPQCTPNLLPCDISSTGPAPVSAYFHPSEAASDGGRTAHFRGRQLRGRHLPLPAGYEGLVLQDTVAASIADGEERRWVERGTFSELGYWKHDDPTAATDPMAKAMDFCRLAGVLHGHHAPPPQV